MQEARKKSNIFSVTSFIAKIHFNGYNYQATLKSNTINRRVGKEPIWYTKIGYKANPSTWSTNNFSAKFFPGFAEF